ncbi:hypothetical protein [Hymenobacter sp. AT01-02]|uniref:hypothetical protein n=1 Tax=Hymenobacter sp. AT01-02 TaxID=1571877 RepID=UPI000A6A8EEC|nr:hypothetical protein [Hymenobacter sp. AT01-02]
MRYLTSFSRLWPALGLSLALLPGCYSRSDMKTEAGTAAGTPTAVPPAEVPAAVSPNTATHTEAANSTQPLQAVNVFLEVSGSMEALCPKRERAARILSFSSM